MRVASGYRADLAAIHDAGWNGQSELAADRLVSVLRSRGTRAGTVVDLGCGSGALAARVAAAGYDVVGIDSSAAMVELARRRVPEATFEVGSFVSAPLPSDCVAVTAVGEVLSYLFDPRAEDIGRVFDRVAAALRPGGIFLFDLVTAGRMPTPAQRFHDTEDYAVLVEGAEEADVLTRRIVTFRRDGESFRREEEVHAQRLHRPAEIAGHLRARGFAVRHLVGYDGRRFARGHAVFEATRRA